MSLDMAETPATKVYSMDDWHMFLEKRKEEFVKLSNQPLEKKYDKDDFDFIYVIGAGAFGKVYLAVLKKTGKQFAIKMQEKHKVLKSKQLKNVSEEKRILQAINFPFCVRLETTFQCPQYSYLCLPFLAGGDLFKHIREQNKFCEEHSKFYAAQLLLALEYLHFLKIVHRDIKPENIVLDKNGYSKLTDFGLSKKINNTRTYTFCGTAEYVAPEIILHKGHGRCVDWWSFGIFLFEMSAGYTPFYAPDVMTIYEKIITGTYEIPEDFSDELEDLIDNLLQVDLSKRYGNLKSGSAAIKDHVWFSSIDWAAIFNCYMPAPFLPTRPVKSGS